jgi:hypothetical protein
VKPFHPVCLGLAIDVPVAALAGARGAEVNDRTPGAGDEIDVSTGVLGGYVLADFERERHIGGAECTSPFACVDNIKAVEPRPFNQPGVAVNAVRIQPSEVHGLYVDPWAATHIEDFGLWMPSFHPLRNP